MIKKIILYYLFFGFSTLTFAQNITDAKGLKQGKWIEKDSDGNPKYEGVFKDNIPTGTFTFFYPNKAIKSKITYEPNGKDAQAIFFHDNGIKKAEGTFINQQKSKRWTYFNADGVLLSEESYINGRKEGASVTYYLDGKKAEVDSFKNDLREGICTKFYPSGQKRVEAYYKEDLSEGRYIEYYENGSFKAMGKYLDGLKSGTWEYFEEDGTKRIKELYDRGKRLELFKLNGEFEEYYPGEVEILKEKVTYQHGKKHGPFIEYYEIGEWKFKTVTPDQTKFPGAQDETVRYFDGGKVKREGMYVQDALDGDIILYNEQGGVSKIETYKKGVKTGERNE